MRRGIGVLIRVSRELKDQLDRAARNRGITTTRFIKEVIQEAVDVESMSVLPVSLDRYLEVFRTSCQEARKGGPSGYFKAGYDLAYRLYDLLPSRTCEERVERDLQLKLLSESMSLHADDGPVLVWFESVLPQYLAMVPPARRKQFVRGVRRTLGYDDQ